MFNLRKIYMPFLCIDLALALFACSGQTPKQEKTEEDLTAKKNLQGIWLDDDDDDVVYSSGSENEEVVVGDTNDVLDAGFVIDEDGPDDIMDVFSDLDDADKTEE